MNRTVTTDFWEDSKVEELGSTAKYVMLYLLTSPRTNLAGCYEVTYKRIGVDTGLSMGQVEKAIAELREADIIGYCERTNEVMIRNWDRYNWTRSPKLDKPLAAAIDRVKDPSLKAVLVDKYEKTRSIPYPYPTDTLPIPNEYLSISISTTSTSTTGEGGLGGDGEGGSTSETVEEVVSYLNAKLGSHYKPKSKGTARLVSARMREGYSVGDFKTVIDKKVADWRNDPKMARYLRPETLFGNKFEGYLNEIEAKPMTYEEVGRERFSEYNRAAM